MKNNSKLQGRLVRFILFSFIMLFEKSLEEKVKILKNLDDEILELIPEDEAETLTN